MSLLFEISKEIWKGNIQIELIIAQSDLSTSNSPSPCYLFVPRMSYLGVVAADSVDYLKSYAIDLASDVWFESEGLPLKRYVHFHFHPMHLSKTCIIHLLIAF